METGQKTIIFLGDGMADEPIASRGHKTPLQVANTPAMDSIARKGRSGTLLTLPEGFPTSSDVANMSVLGCHLPTEFCGRGPLEAAGQGIVLAPGDIAFRMNLTTVVDGILTDFSGGHIEQSDAEALIEALNGALGSESVKFHSGVSYRNLMILSGDAYSADLKAEKPDDNQGNPIAEHLPRPVDPGSKATVDLMNDLTAKAAAILESHPINQKAIAEGRPPANAIWLWSGGSAGAIRTLADKYGIARSAVISAVDVINGLGHCLGMDVIKVPGATGYIDTNYEGKADAAIEALRTHDFVFLHVEAVDEVSHAQDLELKIKAIEDFDKRVVRRVLDAIGPEIATAVLPDHPVPIATGKHTRTPVPVSVYQPGVEADTVQTFDEIACPTGSIGAIKNGDLMALLCSV
ncbi:MAG: cofactor-independent phosphoglycerate mutase [Verrucomicrobia bacterium]|jgi:2,3-bisphosphoglycerate-independent phosphoglycerate mutase|nr:cofactor-independent phosphoglycerate mutase [Verrucomicrobiota bacterium]